MPSRKADEIARAAQTLAAPDEQANFVRRECGSDERLYREVTAMLSGDQASPSGNLADGPTVTESGSTSDVVEKPGDIIGPYRLKEILGSGGFGVVFLADQIAPIQRRVALKMIKPGMDSSEVLARFDAERQTLALMDHPNIAHVYDAGLAPSGRPYFVMEYVEGERITEYCDAHHLSLIDRIRLFQDVCDAIQHAHQKGIIHRDLKPSNILVTSVGDRPLVKVIDFGIAKALHQPPEDSAVRTRPLQPIGTPLYMAPEQACVTPGVVDTRSDIYSLGVVLYVLLTGTTPLDRKKLTGADYSEMRRLLAEEEPPAPSTRVGQTGEALEEEAARRATTPTEWRRTLRGDLDRIVMKCLEKEPARRYATAHDLARDLERFLNHEPVLARAPTWGYRFAKFARRHCVGISVAAGFLLLLIAATVVSTSLALRASKAEQEARRASRKQAELRRRAEASAAEAQRERQAALDAAAQAHATLSFLQDRILAAARPKHRRGGRGIDVSLREVLNNARRHISEHFADQPSVELSVRGVLGKTYWNLGEYQVAASELERAWQLARELHGDTSDVTLELQIEYATVLADADSRHLETACQLLETARKKLEKRLAATDTESEETSPALAKRLRRLHLTASNNLAAVYKQAGRLEEAARVYRILWEQTAEHEEAADRRPQIAANYAVIMEQLGEWDEARKMLEEALAEVRRRRGRRHPATLVLLNNLGPVYHALGDDRHAEATLLHVLKRRERLLGAHHPETVTTMMNLAMVRLYLKEYASAEELYREAWQARSQQFGADDPRTTAAALGIAQALFAQKRFSEAAEWYERCYETASRRSGPRSAESVRAGLAAVRCLEAASDWKAMRSLASRLWQEFRDQDPLSLEGAAVASDLARAILRQVETSSNANPGENSPAAESDAKGDTLMAEARGCLEAAWRVIDAWESTQGAPVNYPLTRRRTAETWALFHQLTGNEREAAAWKAKVRASATASK